ncbi:MAG TPA: S8/S53 family peptidase [Streptosporangiaceae bacterium]|jgi:subtilisin family serine protease
MSDTRRGGHDLDRLLARHPDIALAEPDSGRPALVRQGQVLVAPHDADTVAEAARRWLDRREDRPGACVLRLRGGADPCGITADLGAYGRGHAVAPNHVLRAQPLWFSGPWGAPVPAAAVPAPTGTAAHHVTVAVPDTGLAAHPWWARRRWYRDQAGAVDDVPDGDGDGRLDPAAGHGTFVAGIVLRHAPAARLRAHRVLDGDGTGDEAALLDAIADLARTPGADVLCVASGCHTFDDRPSPLLEAAFAGLGPTCAVVACAGNDGTERPFWPAALDQVIGVAALDGDGRAAFSNHGPWVDACAPGVDVTSAFLTFDGDPGFAGYARWSGTSFAAPAVAGAVADRCARLGEPVAAAVRAVLDPGAHGVVPGIGVPVAAAEHTGTYPYEPQSTG